MRGSARECGAMHRHAWKCGAMRLLVKPCGRPYKTLPHKFDNHANFGYRFSGKLKHAPAEYKVSK